MVGGGFATYFLIILLIYGTKFIRFDTFEGHFEENVFQILFLSPSFYSKKCRKGGCKKS